MIELQQFNERGAINEFERSNDDRANSNWSGIDIDSFYASNVIANSEAI